MPSGERIMSSVQTAYCDQSGRPRLRPSIVGFLDLLGFSQMVVSTSRTDDARQLLDRIVDAINDSRTFVRQTMEAEGGVILDNWSVKFFSDNLVLGYAYDDARTSLQQAAWFVVRCAQHYQFRMAQKGLFLRGGLTYGPVCMSEEIIFGSPLIECYQLESKAAVVPRVVLSEALRDVLTSSFKNESSPLPGDAGDLICRDVDGFWFVNYLQTAINGRDVDWGMIEQHKQAVLQSLSSTTRHDVLPKYGWACRYHNMFCHWHHSSSGYSERYRIDRVDEKSTIQRLAEASSQSTLGDA
jgi:hypothetical protein